MKSHSSVNRTIEPKTTALGSLLTGFGLLCSDFPHQITGLTVLQAFIPDWRRFFAECAFPADTLNQLEEALDAIATDDAILASALATYHTLFTSPNPPVPLWESLWRSKEKIFFTECTTQVRAWYRTHGFVIPSQEAEDFLGYEMTFAGCLFDKAHSKIESNEQATLKAFHQFLTEHLLLWGPNCVHELKEATDNRFWCALFASCSTVLSNLRDQSL